MDLSEPSTKKSYTQVIFPRTLSPSRVSGGTTSLGSPNLKKQADTDDIQGQADGVDGFRSSLRRGSGPESWR